MRISYLLGLVLICLFSACGNKQRQGKAPVEGLTQDMPYRIAVLMGSTHDQYMTDHYPAAKLMRIDTEPDLFVALDAGKADIALLDYSLFAISRKSPGKYTVLEEIFTEDFGMGFNLNNTRLRDEFNRFLAAIKENGVYEEIRTRWFDHYETAEMPQWENDPDGQPLKIGITGSTEGFAFIRDGKPAGFDVELLERFGRSINRPVVFSYINFGGLIAALNAGTVDVITSGMTITEERSRQVAFSDPYYLSATVAIILTERAANKSGENAGGKKRFRSLEDIDGASFAVVTGNLHDTYVSQHHPNTKVLRYESYPDVFMSLEQGKSDVAGVEGVVYETTLKKKGIYEVLGMLFEDLYGVGFSLRDTALRNEFNRFLLILKQNGIYEEMVDRWVGHFDTAEMPSLGEKPEGKPLRFGCTGATDVFDYIKYGKNAGFDIELIERFSRHIGRPVEYFTFNFGGLIAALSSGKVDVISSAMTITEERSKQVAFSDPYFISESLAIVMKDRYGGAPAPQTGFRTMEDVGNKRFGVLKSSMPALKKNQALTTTPERKIPEKTGFLAGVKESFYNNLVVEKRYKLILEGLKETLIITFFATLLGTLFGGIICFMRMNRNRAMNSFAKVYISVMRGTPLLVLLMIFFYVIFASSGLSASVVAIFTFALNMAAYSSEMFRTAIGSVDRGQQEAGIALGFTKLQAFVYIVLPQAVKSVLPVYKGEVISLLKMTSIVGYIAVVDLTKASDIIRSRTFDAFFPLIVVAVIYFLLAWLLGYLLDYINKKVTNT